MADKFYDGMPNVNEKLNEMDRAFAAGPFDSLPKTGGRLTGTLFVGADTISASFFNPPPIQSSASPGAEFEPMRIGVSQTPANWGGFWSFQTSQGYAGSVYADGYRLNIKCYDDGLKNFTAPLLSINGTGDVRILGGVQCGNVLPAVDNTYALGSAAIAYSTIYARTGVINTSDARLKCDFRDLGAAEIAAARDIARAIGAYRWRDAVDCKGDGAREHIGPTVQKAIEIMQAHGLDPFNYGFICHDAWERQTVDHPAVEARAAVAAIEAAPAGLDSLGNLVTPATPANPGFPAVEARAAYTEVTLEAGDRYAFRYDELAMFIAAGQEARLAALEAA